MGIYFRKRVKVLPGVYLNMSKNGTSWSIGPKGAKLNFGKRGTYLSTSIPGTGIYSRTRLRKRRNIFVATPSVEPNYESQQLAAMIFSLFFSCASFFIFLIFDSLLFEIFAITFAIFFLILFVLRRTKKYKNVQENNGILEERTIQDKSSEVLSKYGSYNTPAFQKLVDTVNKIYEWIDKHKSEDIITKRLESHKEYEILKGYLGSDIDSRLYLLITFDIVEVYKGMALNNMILPAATNLAIITTRPFDTNNSLWYKEKYQTSDDAIEFQKKSYAFFDTGIRFAQLSSSGHLLFLDILKEANISHSEYVDIRNLVYEYLKGVSINNDSDSIIREQLEKVKIY